jgi:hypothetical protein
MRFLFVAATIYVLLGPAAQAQSAAKPEWGGIELYSPDPGTYAFQQMSGAADMTQPCVLDAVRLWLRSQKAPATDRTGAYQSAMRLCPKAYVDVLTKLGVPNPVPHAMAAIGQMVDTNFDLLRAGILLP